MKIDDIVGEKLEDRVLKCWECDEEFDFLVGEQEFFKKKEFSPPKRCKPCRDKRRKEKLK